MFKELTDSHSKKEIERQIYIKFNQPILFLTVFEILLLCFQVQDDSVEIQSQFTNENNIVRPLSCQCETVISLYDDDDDAGTC